MNIAGFVISQMNEINNNNNIHFTKKKNAVVNQTQPADKNTAEAKIKKKQFLTKMNQFDMVLKFN